MRYQWETQGPATTAKSLFQLLLFQRFPNSCCLF